MDTVDKVIDEIKSFSSAKGKIKQAYFGINASKSMGLTVPQMRLIAKKIGMNHSLALQLWETGILEAKHIAIFIANPKQIDEKLMEHLLAGFNSWDIVDNCCATLFAKTPLAFEKAIEWTKREAEFQKRAGYALMAVLAIHDKKSTDKKYELFFPYIIQG